ncbi:hypothetical protein AAG570_002616 [Ranatra chinensis]|uniref:Beta-1,4-N-acetylgalactosaminyltransferase n=1 Tax=Ranatra chinensis TaxID=642074 RepID=A0ABD0YWI7_9HEMI
MNIYGSSCVLKGLVVIILALILVQYLYSLFETGQSEQLYIVNASFTDRHPLFSFETKQSNDNAAKNLSAWIYSQVTPVTGGEMTPSLCPLVPPNLVGVFTANKDVDSLEKAAAVVGGGVLAGGQWRPSECRARDRVAVIVPYRDRPLHLCVFLANMHPFLQRQQLDYGIFVIEQAGNGDFNRAMLMNVGFVEALGMRDFDCFIFHDVDLLPEDDRNLYTCPDQPRHMSVAVDVFNYRLPYADIFGGVSAMSREHFEKVNGFSNVFWGWGGEDDDMAARIKAAGLHIVRYPVTVARFENLYNGRKRLKTDGLNSLQYRRLEVRLSKLFTWILVELSAPS